MVNQQDTETPDGVILKWGDSSEGTIKPATFLTGYIDLPIENFFSDYNNGAGVTLERLVPGAVSATEPRLYQLGSANNSYRTLAWIAAAYSTGAANTHRFHTNFRLPGDYVGSTDLTLYLSSTYVVVDDATAATTATIDATARRNIPSAGKEGFGYRADPAVDTWTANTDLINVAATNVLRHTSGDSGFDENTWTIDGDDANFPLAPGNLIQLEFTATLDDGGSNAVMYLANFYVTYASQRKDG